MSVPHSMSIVSRTFTARSHHGIDAVETLWRNMQRDGVCTVYQGIAWAGCVARVLVESEGAQLIVVEVADARARRPLMLLPFVLRRSPAWRVIEWLDFGVCDYAAPLLAGGVVLTAADASRAWMAVRAALPRADILHVDGIPAELFGVPNPLALLPKATRSEQQTFGLPLGGDPETLLKRSCAASFVRDIGKAGRRLAKQGEVRFVVAETADEVEELFAVLLKQRLQRFRELGRVDLLQQPSFVRFYHDAAIQSVGRGPVQLFGVSVGGEWIATAYGLVHNGAFHGILLAMAGGRWRNASPGLYIITEIMRWACARGLSYFDLTVGALHYKEDMGAQSHDLFEISEALTLRGWAVLRARRCIGLSRAWLRRHPKAYERLRTVRRALRRMTGARQNAPAEGV